MINLDPNKTTIQTSCNNLLDAIGPTESNMVLKYKRKKIFPQALDFLACLFDHTQDWAIFGSAAMFVNMDMNKIWKLPADLDVTTLAWVKNNQGRYVPHLDLVKRKILAIAKSRDYKGMIRVSEDNYDVKVVGAKRLAISLKFSRSKMPVEIEIFFEGRHKIFGQPKNPNDRGGQYALGNLKNSRQILSLSLGFDNSGKEKRVNFLKEADLKVASVFNLSNDLVLGFKEKKIVHRLRCLSDLGVRLDNMNQVIRQIKTSNQIKGINPGFIKSLGKLPHKMRQELSGCGVVGLNNLSVNEYLNSFALLKDRQKLDKQKLIQLYKQYNRFDQKNKKQLLLNFIKDGQSVLRSPGTLKKMTSGHNMELRHQYLSAYFEIYNSIMKLARQTSKLASQDACELRTALNNLLRRSLIDAWRRNDTIDGYALVRCMFALNQAEQISAEKAEKKMSVKVGYTVNSFITGLRQFISLKFKFVITGLECYLRKDGWNLKPYPDILSFQKLSWIEDCLKIII